jgi:membrane associated rhomboid family serine protease
MFIPIRDNAPRTRVPLVNYFLIVANIVIFFFTAFRPPSEFRQIVLTFGAVPARPEFITLITSAFLHADIFHIGFNMLFLWIFGDNIEDKLGHLLYLVFYIASAAVAAAVYCLLNAQSSVPVIGASGAVSAVLGAYVILYSHYRVTVFYWLFLRVGVASMAAGWFLAIWFALQIFYGLFETEIGGEVAYSAHIAGFLFGLIIAIVGLVTHLLRREINYTYDV